MLFRPLSLGVVVASVLGATTAFAQIPDHLQCFKIKDAATKAAYTADLTPTDPTFAPAPGCKLNVPAKYVCVDVVKSNVSPAPPGSPDGGAAQKYLCYKTSCPVTQPTASLDDQFGTHAITVKKTGLVCAPVVDPTTCSDMATNGSETDVDCGGGACPACGDGASCAAGSDCTSGVCQAGTCQSQLPEGSVCMSPAQCSSGFCVDGVCCGSACSGLCQGCDSALTGGTNGVCGSVLVGTDPNSECADAGPATCGTTGSCSGTGTCSLYPGGSACSGSSCSGETQTDPGVCDGVGTCVAGSMSSCTPYTCGPTACKTMCAAHVDCTSGNYCSGGNCVPQLMSGAVCSSTAQCLSGSCVDGVCCNTSCSGTCFKCSLAGMLGTCSAIPSGEDPDNECAGTCDGAGACMP